MDEATKEIRDIKLDWQNELNRRRRDKSNYDILLNKAQARLDDLETDSSFHSTSIKNISKIIQSLVEAYALTAQLEKADEEDRKGIALWGATHKKKAQSSNYDTHPKVEHECLGGSNAVTIDKTCYSCTSSNSIVLSAFKMACLAYHPSPLTLPGQEEQGRLQVIQMKNDKVRQVWDRVKDESPFNLSSKKKEDILNLLSPNINSSCGISELTAVPGTQSMSTSMIFNKMMPSFQTKRRDFSKANVYRNNSMDKQSNHSLSQKKRTLNRKELPSLISVDPQKSQNFIQVDLRTTDLSKSTVQRRLKRNRNNNSLM